MDWHTLADGAAAQELLRIFGSFHDGCIREAHLWTETYVNQDLRMSCAAHRDAKLRILFQRQFREPSAIELQFEELVALHFAPTPDNYDSIIHGATVLLRNGVFYWAEDEDWTPDSPGRDGCTWVAAQILRWRDASDWMGATLRYGPSDA
jgi:hypothetical protein